jgi:hypothetical protein
MTFYYVLIPLNFHCLTLPLSFGCIAAPYSNVQFLGNGLLLNYTSNTSVATQVPCGYMPYVTSIWSGMTSSFSYEMWVYPREVPRDEATILNMKVISLLFS